MWPDPSETQGLLHDAGQGDPAAVDRLLGRHRDALRRMVELRLDPAIARRVDASDVVQDVLLEASRRLSHYLQNPAMPFQLWLRHLARDHLIDEHRRHRAASRRSVDRERPLRVASNADRSSLNLADEIRDHQLTPAAEAIRRELRRRFLDALAELDEADREVVLLRHVEHLTNSEAAQALGLTSAAAGMRHLRALRRLRTILGEPGTASGSGLSQ